MILVNLSKKTDYDNKINEIDDKIPSITGLTTATALNAVKSTIPTINDRHQKIKSDNLNIILTDYNKFTKHILGARLKQAKSAAKDDVADFLRKAYFDEKLTNI